MCILGCQRHSSWMPLFVAVLGAFLILGMSATAQDDKKAATGPVIGKPAPDFTVTDIDGKVHALKEYKGKIVVLEWFNPQCPYVKQHHTTGPLKDLGNEMNAKEDIVWIAVNSGAAGKQGTGEKKNRDYMKRWGMNYPMVLDESGEVGKAYGARTTPHMFVIDAKGVLRYGGAIDNAPFGKTPKGEEFTNYVSKAIDEIKADTTVEITTTKPYGCAVKYERKRDGGRGGN